MTSFVSVSTSAARFQDISLNPQKLAGQCAKLKCCMNYEVDAYVEAQKRLPSKEIQLETKDGTFYFFKADILKGIITYSTDKNFMANAVNISARRAFEVIGMNKRGEKPERLDEASKGSTEPEKPIDLLEQESLTRFDKRKNNKRKKKNGGGQKPQGERQQGERQQGERQQGEKKPQGERQQGEKKPQGERQQGGRRPDGQNRNKQNRPPRREGGKPNANGENNAKPKANGNE
jgi:hypothetical protein